MQKVKKDLEEHRDRLLRLDNVIGVGVGHKHVGGRSTGKKSIIVLVSEKKPLSALSKSQAIPFSIGEHETDVIEIGHIRMLGNTQRMRPARPGSSIGHYQVTAGTFGCVVRDRETNRLLILSNNHVLANITNGKDGRADKGDAVLQPGMYDDGKDPEDIIARLHNFVPILTVSSSPSCPIARGAERAANSLVKLLHPSYSVKFSRQSMAENLVDAAVARPLVERDVLADILEIGLPTGVVSAYPGMEVQKSGRTSGHTTGKVLTIGTTITVSMGDVGAATFVDQIVTTPIGQPGDSGSLVLDMERRALGLLAAGSEKATICGGISNVLNLLKVSLVTA